MSLLRSSPFPIQSLHTTDESPLSSCLESQKLPSEFGDCSDKVVSNFSFCNSSYSAGDANFILDEMNWSTANFEHDFSECHYSNDGHMISQEDYLEYLAFNQRGDPVAVSTRIPSVDLHPMVDSSCMETSSSYGSVCSEPEDLSHGGVEQFHLFSEVDGDQYCIESFGVQKTQTNCIKRTYTDGELIESPIAKKHCANSSSPTKPKPKQSPSKDPQSIAAKHRREKISERLKILQDLVPNGSKVDLVTMLEKAINYVKFLQLQVKVLATDEFWPSEGGKAPDIAHVREAIDAVLSTVTRNRGE